MSEKNKKIKVKEPEKAIEPRRPSSISQAFDQMWNESIRDFLVPWRPWRILDSTLEAKCGTSYDRSKRGLRRSR